jgi:WD40 repeat protein
MTFVPNPESNPAFAGYFTRHWQDSLMLSLSNLLSVVFACLPPPRLADYRSTAAKVRRLKEENEALRQRLVAREQQNLPPQVTIQPPEVFPPDDIMDDFYIIAMQEAPAKEDPGKSLKSFLRNITGGGSIGSSSGSSQQQQTSGDSRRQQPVGGSAIKPLSSSLKTQKSRSSSKPRAAVAPNSVTAHAPVKRVVQTSPSVQQPTPSVPAAAASEQSTRTSLTPRGTASGVESGGSSGTSLSSGDKTEKMDYLLLGQEEYLEHNSEITHCRFTTSGLVVASTDVDGVVKVWTPLPSGAPQTQATFISQNSVTALEWIPNTERHFFYGTRSGIVRLCDSNERRTMKEVALDGEKIGVIACSPSGSSCVVGTYNGTASSLLLYDVRTMTKEHDLAADTAVTTANSELTACVFNHNSQMCVASGSDGKVRIFDLRRRRGECISSWSVSGQPRPVLSLCLSQDETAVYAISAEGSFSGWSMYQSGQRIFEHQLSDPYYAQETVYPRNSFGRQFALAGGGKHILTCSTSGGVIYRFDNVKLEKVLGLKGHRRHATCTDWSASNDCGPCVTAGFDGQIRVSTLLSQ